MDISVQTTQYQVENRSWMLSKLGTTPGENPTVTLDVTAFTAGTHYPNGYIPSGTPLGRITASGLYGPYDDTASDGRQTCRELLFSAVRITRQNGSTPTKVGGAGFHRGEVDPAKLPFTLDAAGQADLNQIRFSTGG
jgi:hypothetical protein